MGLKARNDFTLLRSIKTYALLDRHVSNLNPNKLREVSERSGLCVFLPLRSESFHDGAESELDLSWIDRSARSALVRDETKVWSVGR